MIGVEKFESGSGSFLKNTKRDYFPLKSQLYSSEITVKDVSKQSTENEFVLWFKIHKVRCNFAHLAQFIVVIVFFNMKLSLPKLLV